MKNTRLALLLLIFFLSTFLALEALPTLPSLDSTPYSLYCVHVDPENPNGNLLVPRTAYLPESPEEIQPQTLVLTLLALESYQNYHNTFPQGTTLLTANLLDSGVLDLKFSSEYGELLGIQRTAADYALTLTLTELSNVRALRISVFGDDPTVTPPLLRSSDLVLASLNPT